MLAVVALLTTACNSGTRPNAVQLNPQSVSSKPASAAARYLQITPAPGTTGASPTSGITVNALQGAKLASVTVTTDGDPVDGAMNGAGTSWHNDWTLSTGQSYTVTAKGTDSGGHPVASVSTFKTLTPSKTFHTTIFEGAGVTYGVGMSIMLTFDHAITNKAAVERALQVTTSKPVIGAWYWDGDTQVDFRPRDYWPAYTKVSLTAHLDGVDGGNGRYGTHNLTQAFSIGRSLVSVASTVTHKTQVYLDGALKYTWPISTGRDAMPTPNGTYLSEEKANPVRMIGGTKGKPGYYNELVNFAVRFTYSGDYYHSAPWSVVNQGTSNVSHGCVNLAPEDAQIYYNMSISGDPITITGSPKGGNWDNGWTQWFLSWTGLLKGSATGKAVQAGPSGSKFVDPSSLPADHASSPVGRASAGNYLAG
jgi:lipoprotein-anchoring transpeptidase ErfK/SrfK